MTKTLLHTCCGPCASACVPRLKDLGREVTLLFANSNIDTFEEFEHRRREAERLAAAEGVNLVTLPYDHEEWLREVAEGHECEPEKGRRCERCFRYNLGKAAEYAAAHGFDEFTTSLTVSPHKVSQTIFETAREIGVCPFLAEDFKKREGFKLSVRRTRELGLYRQRYCGCEFSKWRIRHKAETTSTNIDAREGRAGDVFVADHQTAGRGRLDHKWLSPPGTNLMMSVVLSVADMPVERIATLPLAIGLAVCRGLAPLLNGRSPLLKWPNDVLVDGRKLSGILCERNGDNIIVGIGVNVRQTQFPAEISDRATSLALLTGRRDVTCAQAMRGVLQALDGVYAIWRTGFAAVYPAIAALDALKGRTLSVRQTDDDSAPIAGVSTGIQPDGSLDVGGTRVYAGEAHVERL